VEIQGQIMDEQSGPVNCCWNEPTVNEHWAGDAQLTVHVPEQTRGGLVSDVEREMMGNNLFISVVRKKRL
jgi:hypothetical protein